MTDPTPVLTALKQFARDPITGFGAPGHNLGVGADPEARGLLGEDVFRCDLLTDKGIDDRTESAAVMDRAWAGVADAWGGDVARISTGGSSESVHAAMAAVAGPGDTVLVARNAHKAAWMPAIAGAMDLRAVELEIDGEEDLEHGVTPATLAAALADAPHAKAVLVVSPTVFGTIVDVEALASLAHAHGIPLIVDAAWGAAYPFCDALPAWPLALGTDIAVASVHKTMGALAQSSVLVMRRGLVDEHRFQLAFDLHQSTSTSIPLVASVDGTRAWHRANGQAHWSGQVALARATVARIDAIDGLRVIDRATALRGTMADVDPTKLVIDVGGLGLTGYAADEWLQRERRVSAVLSDARHLMAVVSAGTTAEQLGTLVDALTDLAATTGMGRAVAMPGYETLVVEQVMPAHRAFGGDTEVVSWADAEGRIAAEILAPTPPAVPRVLPGQRITRPVLDWLIAQADAGGYVADKGSTGERGVRVVRT